MNLFYCIGKPGRCVDRRVIEERDAAAGWRRAVDARNGGPDT